MTKRRRKKTSQKEPGFDILKCLISRSTIAVKTRKKIICNLPVFFNSIETLHAKKISIYGILASLFPINFVFLEQMLEISYFPSLLKQADLFHL